MGAVAGHLLQFDEDLLARNIPERRAVDEAALHPRLEQLVVLHHRACIGGDAQDNRQRLGLRADGRLRIGPDNDPGRGNAVGREIVGRIREQQTGALGLFACRTQSVGIHFHHAARSTGARSARDTSARDAHRWSRTARHCRRNDRAKAFWSAALFEFGDLCAQCRQLGVFGSKLRVGCTLARDGCPRMALFDFLQFLLKLGQLAIARLIRFQAVLERVHPVFRSGAVVALGQRGCRHGVGVDRHRSRAVAAWRCGCLARLLSGRAARMTQQNDRGANAADAHRAVEQNALALLGSRVGDRLIFKHRRRFLAEFGRSVPCPRAWGERWIRHFGGLLAGHWRRGSAHDHKRLGRLMRAQMRVRHRGEQRIGR